MSKLSDLRHRAVKAWLFQTLPTLDRSAQGPTYREADPGVIRAAVARAQCRPSGNWFAFAATRRSRPRPGAPTVGGVEIVAWRGADGALRVAPRACPHLGADLATAAVECGTLVCPWQPSAALGPESRCMATGFRPTTTVCCAGFASTP
ncbi:MAG TPA: Rieske 2Fe-2S domain-containing protein, partial [Mycobacterium sp.]|nr:Rieske 2Fe-2S domain-containing protein [Mycobacterium sp.]